MFHRLDEGNRMLVMVVRRRAPEAVLLTKGTRKSVGSSFFAPPLCHAVNQMLGFMKDGIVRVL